MLVSVFRVLGIIDGFLNTKAVIMFIWSEQRGLTWCMRCLWASPEIMMLMCHVSSGNTQLALQIIKRNQLLPSAVQRVSPDSRKKSIQPFQSVQPIQLPSSFTQVQRKWASTATCSPPPLPSPHSQHTVLRSLDIYKAASPQHQELCEMQAWLLTDEWLFTPFDWGICVLSQQWK